MPKKIRQAYVAGSYSADTTWGIAAHIGSACKAATRLAGIGILPIVPHTSGDHRVTWESAMERCQGMVASLLPGYDLLVLLPGWEGSRGAVVEKGWAEAAGVQVVLLGELFTDGVSEAHV